MYIYYLLLSVIADIIYLLLHHLFNIILFIIHILLLLLSTMNNKWGVYKNNILLQNETNLSQLFLTGYKFKNNGK